MKKATKKILALVLALAMVLSACPFVFAEGEEQVQTEYDFAEYFKTSYEFTGDPAVDYAASLPRVETPNWSVGTYWRGSNVYEQDKGLMYRIGWSSVAYGDDKNNKLTLADGVTGKSTERMPNMVVSYNAPGVTPAATDKLGAHWDGTANAVKGDGGNYASNSWPYGSCLGYAFGSGAKMYNSGGASQFVHQAVKFHAPRAGFVNPQIRIFTLTHDVLAYRVYKRTPATDVWEQIYPMVGETQQTVTNANALNERDANGWTMLNADVEHTRNEGLAWVNAGDEIVFRFTNNTTTSVSKGFSLDTVKVVYTDEVAREATSLNGKFDLRLPGAPADAVYTLSDNSGLVETAVAGVYTTDASFVPESTVTLTVTIGEESATETIKLYSPQMVYDLGEWFKTSNTFTGNMATDYTSTPLTRVPSENWVVGPLWRGSETLSQDYNNKLFRVGVTGRAFEDTKNTTITLADPNSGLPTNTIPNVVASYQNPTNTTFATGSTYPHWNGTANAVKGDGGYGATYTLWPYGGSFGYGFGNGTGVPNSGLTNDVQQAAVFTAPRDGFVNAKIRVMTPHGENTGAVYRVYKNVNGEWTNIYPAPGEVGATLNHTNWTNEKVKTGWEEIGASGGVSRDDGLIWVNAGDKLVFRFGPKTNGYGASRAISVDTVQFNYTYDFAKQVYYNDAVDFRVNGAPANATYTVDESYGLTATATAGVYAVSDDFVSGTVVPVTVDVNGSQVVIAFTMVEADATASFDLAEAFYTSNKYTGNPAVDYATKSQTPVMVNDGNSIWSVGYFGFFGAQATLDYYSPYHLLVRKEKLPAYEDLDLPGNPTMVWTTRDNNYVKLQSDGGYGNSSINFNMGSLGYNFSSGEYVFNGAVGHSSSSNTGHQSAIFTAPYDGVVVPYLKVAAGTNNLIAYRVYKKEANGTITSIYPTVSQNKVSLGTDWNNYEGWELKEGWGMLTDFNVDGWLEQNKGVVRVKAGDQIILRFAAGVGGNSQMFALDTFRIDYTDQFGPDDELLLDSPMANYEDEKIDLVYPKDESVDVRRAILNPEAQGTIEYALSGNTAVLRETATAGVYAPTGVLNAGGEAAVVTAGYYSKGKSSANGDAPLYTTSIEVYVHAASMGVESFSYDLFKATQLGYDYDGFILPYYTDATERAMYGVIDLGLTDEWKGAVVKLSDTTKFEYLGNGRIKVKAKHDYKDAGGPGINHGSSTAPDAKAPSYNGNPAVRDTTTMGEDTIVMKIWAADGGYREYNLWSYPVKVQGDTASNVYSFDYNTYAAPSAVLALEGVIDMDTNGGSFKKMYKDNAQIAQISPVTDDMYLHAQGSSYWFPRVPTFNNQGNFDFWAQGEAAWTALTNTPYVDYDGLGWAFTAPKDGTVNLKNHLTEYLFAGNPGYWLNKQHIGAVRKYAVDGTYVDLLTYTYGDWGKFDITHDDGTYAANDGSSAKFNRVSAKAGTMLEELNDDGSLDIEVKKGEIIRIVILNNADDTGWISNYQATRAEVPGVRLLPNPVFTYAQEYPDAFNGDLIEVTPADFASIVKEGVLTVFYGADGAVIGSSNEVDEAAWEAEYVGVNAPAETAFAKIFFFDSLDNIQPIVSDILVRK